MKDFWKMLAATVSGCPIPVEPKEEDEGHCDFDKEIAASVM